jgi:phosphoglucomutase
MLVDAARLQREYYTRRPDLDDPTQLVRFGTSGRHGSPLHGSFTGNFTRISNCSGSVQLPVMEATS